VIRKPFRLMLCILLSFAILTACGPSQAEVVATATQTAQAPTATKTYNPSPTATLRPTPTRLQVPSATFTTIPTLTLIPTRTQAPFIPADLVIINLQNAPKLRQVAALPEKDASVATYSADSRWLATGFFDTNLVKIWDLANGEELLTLSGHIDPRNISYLAFSPDGSRLASGARGWEESNDSLILWDTSTGRELQRFSGVLGAISPDWHLVALTQREHQQAGTLILYDLASSEEIHTLEAPGEIYAVSFSPQGEQVAATMYSVFQDLFSFWWVDSGQLDRTLYDWVSFSYSPDGRYIAALLDIGAGDRGELNIIDAATFKWIKTLTKDADTLWFAYPAFSPDGQVLAASCGDHVTLWDTKTGLELTSLPTSGPTGLVFSPDGRILTTFTHSGIVQLWGVLGGQ
jgi:WD40 repeat protein